MTGPARLPFSATPADHAALRAVVERDGYAILEPSPSARSALATARDPYAVAALLFSAEPPVLERQVIRPLPGARSFAAGKGVAPLHTDSQRCRGIPAHALVMLCDQAASDGGDTLLCDGHALLRRALVSPAGLHDLAARTSPLRFYFGTFDEAFVTARGGALFVTCPPQPPPWVAPWVRVDARFHLFPGEILVVDNHRMLHGRAPFDDDTRAMTRLLCWLDAPFAVPADLVTAVHAVARPGPGADGLDERTRAVLALLRGTAPGPLAARLGVDEARLYQWRDAVLTAAQNALARR